VKHQFDMVIKSKTSDVVLAFNTAIGKWEALEGGKVIARRKSVAMLVAAINSQVEAA